MSSPLAYPSFRRLFAAQICSLTGVGLLTVALSLLAFRLGGEASGGQILGLILALKMVAYVLLAPVAETVLAGVSRKAAMVVLDLGRLFLLVPMFFVTEFWQMAALAFAFFVLASGFTPMFQSVIPDVLPDEDTYSRALAWSRIAYTVEAVASPVVAGVLLSVVSGQGLFLAAAVAFAGSVIALLITRFPPRGEAVAKGPFLKRVSRGLWIYGQTPRLRGLFLLNLALSLAMAWVLVNSVVYAGARLGNAEDTYPVLMAFYGLGAALGAVLVPRLVRLYGERASMILGAFAFAVVGVALSVSLPTSMQLTVPFWVLFGIASSLVLTPGGLVITKSVGSSDRTAVFAAQFSLSHAGWLVAYPLAGWLAAATELETALVVLSALCAMVAVLASRVWPAHDPLEREHAHPELPDDHPHLNDVPAEGRRHRHKHAYRIDSLHEKWVKEAP